MGRQQTEETKQRISSSLKGNIPWNKGVQKFCKVCSSKLRAENKTGFCKEHLYKSKEWKNSISKSNKGKTGGIREGSVRNHKSGRYDEIWFDSSWELAYYVYHKEHGIHIKRNKQGFTYIFEDNEHLYYPDFVYENEYVEIKGLETPEVEEKIKQFPEKLLVLRRKQMKLYIDYMTKNYGKNYWLKFYNK